MPLSICVNRKSQAIIKYLLGVNSPIDWSKKGHSPKQCVSLTFKGNGNCGLTVHNPGGHLADYVEGWGPLWAWSTFGLRT